VRRALTRLIAVADIVTPVFLLTLLVVIVKVPVRDPDATVILAGTGATPLLLLDNVTTVPAAGAGPVSVTVPVEVPPPRREAGLRVRDVAAGGVMVKDAVRVVPL
jgi:hypothetical protein